METGFKQAPELVFVTGAEKSDRIRFSGVLGVDPFEGLQIEFLLVLVNKGTDKLILVEEMDTLWWCINVF